MLLLSGMNTRTVEWLLVTLQFLLLALLLYPYDRPSGSGFGLPGIMALALMGAGVVTGSLAVYQMRRHISAFPTPRADSHLLQTGIYSYIRHPMYTAILSFGIGYAWWCIDFYKLLIVFVLLILFQWKSEMEEGMLQRRFTGYRDYAIKTGKFLPVLFSTHQSE